MKRGVVILSLVAVLSQMSANPLAWQVAKKAMGKKVLIKGVKNGKMILQNFTSGKTKAIKWKKMGYYIQMPKKDRGSVTSHGFLRSSKKFWQEFKKKYPHVLSPRNKMRINSGKAPVVDKKWGQYFKLHKPFNGQKLEHHHMGKGAFAVPLPQGLHRGKGNSGWWHEKRK